MPFLELKQVTFSYPGKTRPALADIDLAFEKKEISAVMGPNGSGKTTLTKLMIGVLKPGGGEINLASRPISDYSLAGIGRRIGYVFQNPELQLFCSTAAEEIGFGLTNQGCEAETVKNKVDFYLDYFDLAKYRNTFPLHLSQGEKQRLVIAAVLANDSDFLILDEPTTGLDAYRKKNLEDYLKKVSGLGRGMILISHDEDFVDRMAQRVIIIEDGRVLSDMRRKGNSAYET